MYYRLTENIKFNFLRLKTNVILEKIENNCFCVVGLRFIVIPDEVVKNKLEYIGYDTFKPFKQIIDIYSKVKHSSIEQFEKMYRRW